MGRKEVTKMKIFECIVNDGNQLFKSVVAVKNKKELLNVYGGNGEFEKITDVTNNYPVDENKLYNALRSTGYGRAETNLLVALLSEHNKTLK